MAFRSRFAFRNRCMCYYAEPPRFEAPEDHKAVVNAASSLLRARVITEDEYNKIVNGDLQYRKQLEATNALKRQKQLEVPRDPITLDPLGALTYTVKFPHAGSSVTYNLESLVTYLNTTDAFVEPTTRWMFTEDMLEEIEMAAYQAGIDCESLVDRYNYPNLDMMATYRHIRETAEGYDAILGEVIVEMLNIVEGRAPTGDEPSLPILLMEFDRVFSLMKHTDIDFSWQCLSSYTSYLLGPQTRPSSTSSLALRTIMRFLKQQWSEDDAKALEAYRLNKQAMIYSSPLRTHKHRKTLTQSQSTRPKSMSVDTDMESVCDGRSTPLSDAAEELANPNPNPNRRYRSVSLGTAEPCINDREMSI